MADELQREQQNDISVEQNAGNTVSIPPAELPPSYTTAVPSPHSVQPETPRSNTIAIVAFVLSIVAIIIPFLPVVSFVLAVFGIVKARRSGGKSIGLAISGLIISIVVLLIHGLVVYKVNEAIREYDSVISKSSSVANQSVGSDATGLSEYFSATMTDNDVSNMIKTTQPFFVKLDSSDPTQSYGMFSDYYKNTNPLSNYRQSVYPVVTSLTRSSTKPIPVWISKVGVGEDMTYGIMYNLDGNTDFSKENRYLIFALDTTKTKIDGIRIARGGGAEVKKEEAEFVKATHKLVFPSDTKLSRYEGGIITSK